MRERFEELRRMGIRTIMITGDNPLTAATIAARGGRRRLRRRGQAGGEDRIIREQQAEGHLVAMTGDGTNDAPALAQADVGLAMNSGTAAAKEAANMVDLDSNPTKLIEVVRHRQAAADHARRDHHVHASPTTWPSTSPSSRPRSWPPTRSLSALNIMGLATPESAILSAVIFNALIIIALVPLALRGVGYRPVPAAELLRRNLLIYGLGGIVAPFIGIKIIDVIIIGAGAGVRRTSMSNIARRRLRTAV